MSVSHGGVSRLRNMNGMKQEQWTDPEVMNILTSADIIIVHLGGMVVIHVVAFIYLLI